SVQSMDRYHEEYHRLGDKHAAIVESYSHLFPPAIASILADGFAILVVAIAPIPLIQKVAVFSSFWVISIFVSVVTLHPIILSVINPPGMHVRRYARWLRWLGHGLLIAGGALFALFALRIALELLGPVKTAVALVLCVGLYAFHEQIYKGITHAVIAASAGRRRWAVAGLSIALYIFCPQWGWRLKVGDMTPGAALLFPEHPYNVAYAKLNDKFLGASQLVVIADTGKENGMKDVGALTTMEEFADHMETVPGAGASVTIIDIVKQLSRLFHEGEPKWAFVPDKQKYIAELFYQFTQSAQAGDLDRFLSADARYGTVITLFRGYSHDVIMNAINSGKSWAAEHGGESVQFLFAGGGVGVDYGIYHFSRMLDAFDEGRNIEDAVDYATATTGKAIIFTATTMVAGTIFWWFSALKFQAEMGLLLALLMLFNTFGGLVIVPAWVKILNPRFLTERRRGVDRVPDRLAVG